METNRNMQTVSFYTHGLVIRTFSKKSHGSIGAIWLGTKTSPTASHPPTHTYFTCMTPNGDEIRPHLFLKQSPETIWLFLIRDTRVSRGGGSPAEWDGCNRPSLWGHAGTEQPSAAAATREGRRQFQADEWANQIQPNLQAAERGEGGVGRPSSHIQNTGDV